jgi:antitoxin ParD1/3/4/toxin ParE1/3/4
MKRFKLSRAAQTDLESIGEYLAETAGAEQAVEVVSRIRLEFQKLAEMPGIGHYREDLLDQRYRFWRVYSYLIVYRWETDPIRIIAVVHGARNLIAFLSKRTRK